MEFLEHKIYKKHVFLWVLYDFANSIAIITFALYFSQWLVIDNHVSDLWYNLIFAGSSILLIATAPVMGAIADKRGARMPYLKLFTVLMFIMLIITSLLALINRASPATLIMVCLSYLLANYFYQFSFSFYNPLLNDIAPPEKQGMVSGLGQSSNWLGMIVGLIITLPLAGGSIYLFGQAGRAQTFLPATVIFFALALPMLLLFKERQPANQVITSIKDEYKNYWAGFLGLFRQPGMGRFWIGYFLFSDAMITIQNNYPIYMQQVFGVSDKTKSFLLLAILATSVIGALVSGIVADRLGLKPTLLIILFGWTLLFPLLGGIKIFSFFVALTVIIGFLYGSIWTVTRAIMVELSPKDKLNHAFSYYTLAERFATFLGPLTWGVITSVIFHSGAARYRIAAISMTVFVLGGLIIVWKLPSSKKPATSALQTNGTVSQ